MSGGQIAVGVALDEAVVSALSYAEIAKYADASGDNNPVHTDQQLAKSVGLDDVPVQGMLLMALINNYLEDWKHHSATRKLSVRFVAPALANQDLKITARIVVADERNQTAILRVLMFQAEKMVVMGEAEIAIESS